jgi:hypothetical protein
LVSSRNLFVILLVVFLMFLAPQSDAVAATYSTRGFVALGVAETTQLGTKSVVVNYTNTLSIAVSAFIYIYLTNSAGQTINIQLSGTHFSAGQNRTLFFGLVGVAPGTYTASLFATTNSLVPVSPVTTIKVVL